MTGEEAVIDVHNAHKILVIITVEISSKSL